MDFNNRTSHIHVIGATGSGKTKFLELLGRSDIQNGVGCCVISGHRQIIDDTMRWTAGRLPTLKIHLFQPGHSKYAPGFNLFTSPSAVEQVIAAIRAVFGEDTAHTPLTERCMRASFLVAAEHHLTLLEVLELTRKASFATTLITERVKDPLCRKEWQLFCNLSPRDFLYYFQSTNNRLSRLLAIEAVRNVLGQRKTVDLIGIMERGEVLLVDVSVSTQLPFEHGRLLGILLVNSIFQAALKRPENARPFHVYIDECARFVIPDVAHMLEECRKFGVFLTLAHQDLNQLKHAGVYESVMTNARSKVIFGGLSWDDAKVMVQNVFPEKLAEDVVKRVLDRPMVVAHDLVELKSRSNSFGGGWGESESRSTGTERVGTSKSDHTNSSSTEGWNETWKPVIQTLPTATYSVEEKLVKLMSAVMNLPVAHAVVKPAKKNHTVLYRTPFVVEGVANDKRLASFQTKCLQRSKFVSTIEEVKKDMQNRITNLFLPQPGSATPEAETDETPLDDFWG